MCWFNYKIAIGSQRKTIKFWLNFNLNFNIQKTQKQIKHESNELCMLQAEEKVTKMFKRIKTIL